MYYTQEQIDRANQADLVSFLQSQGEQLTRAGQEYRWKRHDSLTVRGNKWYRHSQSKGGGPVDFVMEFFGKSFTEAVELSAGVVVSVAFQEVDGSPNAETGTEGDDEGLENADSRVEKFHICVAGIIGCW